MRSQSLLYLLRPNSYSCGLAFLVLLDQKYSHPAEHHHRLAEEYPG
jgi:hypothetical protein